MGINDAVLKSLIEQKDIINKIIAKVDVDKVAATIAREIEGTITEGDLFQIIQDEITDSMSNFAYDNLGEKLGERVYDAVDKKLRSIKIKIA